MEPPLPQPNFDMRRDTPLVRQGQGYAFLWYNDAASVVKAGNIAMLRITEPQLMNSLCLVRHRQHPLSRVQTAVGELLVSFVAGPQEVNQWDWSRPTTGQGNRSKGSKRS